MPFAYFLCSLVTLGKANANDIYVIKYAYGKRGWNGVEYEPANVRPLYSYRQYYSVSDIKSIKTKKLINVDFRLLINKKDNAISSLIIFKNNGDESVFIPELSFSEWKMNFIITTDNMILEYLGGKFNYGGDFEKDDWIEVPTKISIVLTQGLNKNYNFLPGRRIYRINSVEYTIVNNKWFIYNSIYKSFISIVMPKKTTCITKKIRCIF